MKTAKELRKIADEVLRANHIPVETAVADILDKATKIAQEGGLWLKVDLTDMHYSYDEAQSVLNHLRGLGFSIAEKMYSVWRYTIKW